MSQPDPEDNKTGSAKKNTKKLDELEKIFDTIFTSDKRPESTPKTRPESTPKTRPESTPKTRPESTPKTKTTKSTPAPTPGSTPAPTPGSTPAPTPGSTPAPTPGSTPDKAAIFTTVISILVLILLQTIIPGNPMHIGSIATGQTIPVPPMNQDNDYEILFKSGPYTPLPGFNIKEIQSADHQPNGLVHFLLQFKHTPTLSEIYTLSNNHITVGPYITGNTYIASANFFDVTESNLNSTFNARWADVIKPDYKISYDLKNKSIPNWSNYSRTFLPPNYVAVTMQLQNGTDLDAAESYVRNELKGTIVGVSPSIPSMTVIINIDKIHDTASKDFSLYLDFVDPPLSSSDSASKHIVGADLVQTGASHLTGSSVKIMEYDEFKINDAHPALIGNVENSDNETSQKAHSTWVAGMLVGNDASNTDAEGVAPDAHVFGYINSGKTDTPEMWTMYNGTNDLVNDFTNAIHDNSVDLATMSLNSHVAHRDQGAHCELQGDYSFTAKIIDGIIHGDITALKNNIHKKLIFIESAGNGRGDSINYPCSASDPYKTIDPPATAKNSIVVGAINALDNKIANMSSFGPTDDGRIKPDLVAPGTWDNSTGLTVVGNDQDVNGYASARGTSISTPVVSGSTALLIQKYRDVSGNQLLLPHTAKAILIHTAINPQGVGPDYEYGWGILNIAGAIDLINNAADITNHIREGDTGSNADYHFNSLGPDVKATLVWDDPPSQSLVNTTLVNNLDVELVDKSHHIFNQSFTCSKTSCQLGMPHQQGVDDKNNIKMVIAHGSTGTWTAKVIDTKINSGNQDFTLIVTSYTPSGTHLPPPLITTPPNCAHLGGNGIMVKGTADPGKLVKVMAGNVSDSTISDTNGNWQVQLNNLPSGWSNILALQSSSSDDSLYSNIVPVLNSNQTNTIPIWIKTNAKWWVDDTIPDDQYVMGLQYMIKNGIIKIPHGVSSSSATNIPIWIKTNAKWWVECTIPDDQYVMGLQYMIANGIIELQ